MLNEKRNSPNAAVLVSIFAIVAVAIGAFILLNASRRPLSGGNDILIEADGTARLLPNGVKSAETLLEEIGELNPIEPEDGDD